MSRDIYERWNSHEGMVLAAEVFGRFSRQKPLDDLNLGTHHARIDLRGIHVPAVDDINARQSRNWTLFDLKGNLKFKGLNLHNVDFSGADLSHARFFDSRIENCCFDRAHCEDWRLWGTNVTDSSFRDTNLNQAMVGAWYEGRGNVFRNVSFSKAVMKSLISPAATYVDCDFSHARLEKIDFQSSSFVRCRFAGELREVTFYDHGFKTGKLEPNLMEDIDFLRATLRWVEFRRLNLDRVILPDDDLHLVVKKYRCVLDQVVQLLQTREEPYAIGLRGIIKNRIKWAGPTQNIGIFSRLDFKESLGSEGDEFAVEILKAAERSCTLAN